MAEQHTINPRITSTTRDLLRRASEERRASQGDIVEAALLAFLTPQEEASPGMVVEQLTRMDTALVDIVELLRLLLTHREAMTHEHDEVLQQLAALDTTLGTLGMQLLASAQPKDSAPEDTPQKIATAAELYGPEFDAAPAPGAEEPAPVEVAPLPPPRGRRRRWWRRGDLP